MGLNHSCPLTELEQDFSSPTDTRTSDSGGVEGKGGGWRGREVEDGKG